MLAILLIGSLLTVGYMRTGEPVTVVVNGLPRRVYTHQTSVEGLLREVGLVLQPEDVVYPALKAELQAGQVVVVRQARRVHIEADGREIALRTHEQSVAAILQQAGVSVGVHDRVLVDGREVALLPAAAEGEISVSSFSVPTVAADRSGGLTSEQSLSLLRVSHRELSSSPSRTVSQRGEEASVMPSRTVGEAPLHIVVRRARPVYLNDDGVASVLYTTMSTVGEALRAEGITLYLGDEIHPSLGSRVSSGMRIYIRRARPVEIAVDGRTIKSRTRRQTVGEVLAEQGIALVGNDYVEPAPNTPVTADMQIRVVRVQEKTVIEQEPIPFETAWQPDPAMELDQRRLVQEGANGVNRRRWRVIYHDGREVSRALEDEWVAVEPTTKVIAYGTKIVIRELQTPDGTFQYWRKIRMLATAYTEATCGKDPDHPYYGITYLGWKMRHGIVAVDPRVINLRSKVYVFGYGEGVAADTGGAIKGQRIDLGYDVDNFVPWYHWVDVYLLTPVPPADRINWILPNWPRERR